MVIRLRAGQPWNPCGGGGGLDFVQVIEVFIFSTVSRQAVGLSSFMFGGYAGKGWVMWYSIDGRLGTVLQDALFWFLGYYPQRVIFVGRRVGTPRWFCLVGRSGYLDPEGGTVCAETSANKYKTLGNILKTRVNYSDHGKGLKAWLPRNVTPCVFSP